MSTLTEKSEILFIYESKFSVPNGDPFTSEQRYDEETKKILVSDVRIKRFIRDYFISQNLPKTEKSKYEIFVYNEKSQIVEGSKESGASARMQKLWNDYYDKKPAKKDLHEAAKSLLQKCIDVRLFGGISTEKEVAVNITGPVQFGLLNPSLNKVDLRIHQNTTVFSSSADKTQGSIGTTSVVPYSVNKIHGWINPYSAINSGLNQEDVNEMFTALWNSINNANTRSKSNQSSMLLLQIVYAQPEYKLYGTSDFIKIKTDKEEEQLRSFEDFEFDFSKMNEAIQSDKVLEIRYYTEIEKIENQIKAFGSEKFKKLSL